MAARTRYAAPPLILRQAFQTRNAGFISANCGFYISAKCWLPLSLTLWGRGERRRETFIGRMEFNTADLAGRLPAVVSAQRLAVSRQPADFSCPHSRRHTSEGIPEYFQRQFNFSKRRRDLHALH